MNPQYCSERQWHKFNDRQRIKAKTLAFASLLGLLAGIVVLGVIFLATMLP
jgi:hypothetical protein